MKCLLCEKLSFEHICPACQNMFLTPSIYKQKIFGNVEVISFYKYSDIKKLLHTKHTNLGFYIYSILAEKSFKKFAENFTFQQKVASLSIDDHTKNGYSHTAILNKKLQCAFIAPHFNKLRAKNKVSYSGKTKEFRLLNPRNFEFKNFKEKDVILVDDIITTGSTLTQALQVLQKNAKNPLFCLTLANASIK